MNTRTIESSRAKGDKKGLIEARRKGCGEGGEEGGTGLRTASGFDTGAGEESER